jgi:hypothetical protein
MGVKFRMEVLRRLLGLTVEVIGRWRKLHEEEFHNIYVAPRIILTINSTRKRWARHMARMQKMRNTCI